MSSQGELLKNARLAAALSQDQLASWARVDPSLLRDAEAGTGRLSAHELDRCARVFGLRLEDLLRGEAGRAPMTLLLRSQEVSALDWRAVLTTELHFALGEFQRAARDVADLERALGIAVPELRRLVPKRAASGIHPGDMRARCLRDELGLGNEPISSVRALASRLGIHVFWVTEDHMVDRSVEGACVRVPRPAILVNLIQEGNRYPWRARITLAHELGHLLFDTDSAHRQVLVSPGSQKLPAALDEMESTARAFAACLLAPSEGVRRLIGNLDPSAEEAIQVLGTYYGVGRTVAINRLHRVFGLSDAQWDQMQSRSPKAYQGDFSCDQPPEPIGFRGEPLRALVYQALKEKKIPASRARKMLGLSPTEPFPFADLAEAYPPPISAQQQALRAAVLYLSNKYPNQGLVPDTPEPREDGWSVPVWDGGVGALHRSPRGYLQLAKSGQLVHDRVEPEPASTR